MSPQAEFVPNYNTLDGGTWATSNFTVGAATAAKNVELDFLATFLCWRFSEREGVRERGMRFSGSSRVS